MCHSILLKLFEKAPVGVPQALVSVPLTLALSPSGGEGTGEVVRRSDARSFVLGPG